MFKAHGHDRSELVFAVACHHEVAAKLRYKSITSINLEKSSLKSKMNG